MKTKLFLNLAFLFSITLSAQTPYKIKTKDSGSSLVFAYNRGTVFNNNFYFNANSDETPSQTLLKYDGANRAKILGLIPLTNSPIVSQISESVVFNNRLYFEASGQESDGTGSATGDELWSYDGTNEPNFVANINPGSSSGVPNSSTPKNFTVFNGNLLFSAETNSIGRELFIYDGTNAPTSFNIKSGSSSSNPNYLTEYNSKIYFAADGLFGNELYEFDGTNTPTLVADINPVGNGTFNSNPAYLTTFKGLLYFAAEGDTGGTELWQYDGINTPTLVADLNAGGSSNPQNLIVLDGNLYFTADDGTNGRELWKYDGINTPTLTADINAFGDGFATATYGAKLDFIILDDVLYFSADNGSDGFELFKFDGTNLPLLVADINLGLMGSNPDEFTVFNGAIYFKVDIFGQYDLYKYHPNETRFLDNPANQNWFSATNWSNGVPNVTKEVYLPENVDISLPINASAKKITLEKGGKLQLKKAVNLEVDGDIGIAEDAIFELESDNDQSATLLANGTVSGIVTYKRLDLTYNLWYLFSSPVISLSFKDFVDNSSNVVRTNTAGNKYAIGTYNDANTVGNKWEYLDKNTVENDNAGNFLTAKGYTLSFSGGGPNFAFTGAVNNNSTTSINLANNQWNLIGNPYLSFFPANRNTNSALADNLAGLDDSFKALYFWSANQNKYVAFGSETTNTKYIHPGQAFFIKAKPSAFSETFTFLKEREEAQPAINTVSFNKTNPSSKINITLIDDKFKVETAIHFNENATNGLDVGLDIGNFDGSELDVYTKLVDSSLPNINFTKQTLNKTTNAEIPLGITAKANNDFTLKISKINLSDINVYLFDEIKNKDIEITEEGLEYEFTSTENLNGIGRFSIKTQSKVLTTVDSEITKTIIYTVDKRLHIKQISKDIKQVFIYNLQGKLIQTITPEKNNILFDMNGYSNGIYLISLLGKEIQETKKIVLK